MYPFHPNIDIHFSLFRKVSGLVEMSLLMVKRIFGITGHKATGKYQLGNSGDVMVRRLD